MTFAEPSASDGAPPATVPATVVEVLPDVAGLDRTFHYLVPASFGDVPAGTVVRVALHGRRTRGWVVAAGTAVPDGLERLELKAIREVVSLGPPPSITVLCRWAAWRYAGRLRPFLMAASSPRIVRSLPPPLRRHLPGPGPGDKSERGERGDKTEKTQRGEKTERSEQSAPMDAGLRTALEQVITSGDAVLRLPPRMPRLDAVVGLLELSRTVRPDAAGDPLVLVESRSDALILAGRLRGMGWPVSLYPEDWAPAAAGGRVVVGTRNAVFAPVSPSIVVVLDAHGESYRSERVPTFDARVVAAERARASGVPVCFVTPCPSLELLDGRRLVTLERSRERNGWGTVTVLDGREEDPREGGYPAPLVSMVRAAVAEQPGGRVVLVLNRSGRARLLACGLCRNVQRCPECGGALGQPARPPKGEIGELACPRCQLRVPALCAACGSARLRILRPGVFRAREEVAALLGMEEGDVGVVAGPAAAIPDCRVLVGTESVLHRVPAASMVGFLDFDHELLASRFRAGEQALVLLARGVRIAGGPSRSGGAGAGRVVIRTSMPEHEVVRAAQRGDPAILTAAEEPSRRALRLPPVSALAVVSGAGARTVAERLVRVGVPTPATAPDEAAGPVDSAGAETGRSAEAGSEAGSSAAAGSSAGAEAGTGVEVAPLGEGRFLVRASGPDALADAFAAVIAGEPGGWAAVDARVEVDPVDI